ncbi:hypothetical protein [Hydrogenimonas urashimensis]|uniref:hypothetical protein n=1 Tax=Hydrogenimonas urashimensis TaxID=2740515 RepID=UPI001916A8EA|nr:hypothetical protein [Hydrogenimonas urashimensis]
MTEETYCAQLACDKKEHCRHYQRAKEIAPDKAFMMRAIEESQCSPKNGWLKYLPSKGKR